LLFAGDTIYIYYEHVLEEDPYLSIADVFFLLYYPFTAYHLIRNIGYFKKDFNLTSKLFVPGLTLAIVLIFALISFDEIEGHTFDFYFGMIFVFGSSLILSLAILGVTVFRRSILGVAWLLLAVGIFLFTFADVWYYYLEIIEEYSDSHFTNTLWITSNMIIVYALYKHKKNYIISVVCNVVRQIKRIRKRESSIKNTMKFVMLSVDDHIFGNKTCSKCLGWSS